MCYSLIQYSFITTGLYQTLPPPPLEEAAKIAAGDLHNRIYVISGEAWKMGLKTTKYVLAKFIFSRMLACGASPAPEPQRYELSTTHW